LVKRKSVFEYLIGLLKESGLSFMHSMHTRKAINATQSRMLHRILGEFKYSKYYVDFPSKILKRCYRKMKLFEKEAIRNQAKRSKRRISDSSRGNVYWMQETIFT
jgi:hypothetical protein